MIDSAHTSAAGPVDDVRAPPQVQRPKTLVPSGRSTLHRMRDLSGLRRKAAGIGLSLSLLLASCTGEVGPNDDGASPEPTSPPVAAADYAAVGLLENRLGQSLADLGLTEVPLPDPKPVAWSHFVLTVSGVAVTDELSPDQFRDLRLPSDEQLQGRDRPLLAGKGREFLVTLLGRPKDARPDEPANEASATVRAADQAPQELSGIDIRRIPGVVVAVSVPTGGDATLEITDGGQTKSVSLRSGRQESGENLPADVLAGDSEGVTDYFHVDGITLADTLESVQCRVSMESMSHSESAGAAEPGHMWLGVEVAVTFSTGVEWLIAEHATISVDLAGSLTVTSPNGNTLPIRADVEPNTPLNPGITGTWSGEFAVRDTLRTLRASFRLHATFTDKDSGRVLPFTRHDQGRNAAKLTLTGQ